MRYKEVYHFLVLDEIKKDNTVYGLDKKRKTVFNCNRESVERLIEVLEEAKGNTNRYEFWMEIKESEDKENA